MIRLTIGELTNNQCTVHDVDISKSNYGRKYWMFIGVVEVDYINGGVKLTWVPFDNQRLTLTEIVELKDEMMKLKIAAEKELYK